MFDEMRVPPNDQESEMAVLGAMMLDKGALEYASEHLKAVDFYQARNASLFDEILAVERRGLTVDLVSVAAEIKAHGGEAGDHLSACVDAGYRTDHIQTYARLVKEKSTYRAIINGFLGIVQECQKQSDEPNAILEQAEQIIYSASASERRGGLIYLKEPMLEAIDAIDKMNETKRPVQGVETGFREFDKLTMGLHPGNLVILAARPGMGKTSLALNIIENVALKSKVPTIFYSLEMSNEEIVMRLLSSMSGIGLRQIRTGFTGTAGMDKIRKVSEEIYEAPLILNETSGLTATGVRSSARRMAGKLEREGKKLGLIVVDYLQLLHGPAGKRFDGPTEEVTEVSRALKNLAVDLKVPVLALSQLNRSTEEHGSDGRPRLSHLRQSGAIEQDADLVAFIYRPAFYQKGAAPDERRVTELLIEKHRNGSTGSINMIFQEEITRFREVLN